MNKHDTRYFISYNSWFSKKLFIIIPDDIFNHRVEYLTFNDVYKEKVWINFFSVFI